MITIGSILVYSVVITFFQAMTAPVGYETEYGFFYGVARWADRCSFRA